MPQDAFTIYHTALELNKLLVGAKIDKANQPDKDTIILTIRVNGKNERLCLSANASLARICLTEDREDAPLQAPSFCMLLRKHLVRGIILKVYAIEFERIIALDILCKDELGVTSNKTLYVEIMGKYSNLILCENGKILGAIKTTNLDFDITRQIFPGIDYILPTPQEKIELTNETATKNALKTYNETIDLTSFIFNTFKGFSKQTAKEIATRFLISNISKNPLDINAFYKFLIDFYFTKDISPNYSKSLKPIDFYAVNYISDENEKVSTKLLTSAIDIYFTNRKNSAVIDLRRRRLFDTAKAFEKKISKKLQIVLDKILACEDMQKFQLFGELIISNLYKIKQGETKVEVNDYTKEDYPLITIELDKTISPKKNAEKYFKKYNKLKKTLQAVLPQKEELEQTLEYLKGVFHEIERAETLEDFNDIQEELENQGLISKQTSNKKEKKKLSKPRYFEYLGYEIFVGRNNLQNDRLTLSADRYDLWLHTKNYHSSHVIIKSKGTTIPDEVILFAAEICAYYSQAKNSDKIPVDYTFKKFVKKPPKSPVGTVYYTDYQTILVTPSSHQE